MVPFVVMRCGNTVRVSGEIVELCSALVRIVWHVLFSLRRNDMSNCDKGWLDE